MQFIGRNKSVLKLLEKIIVGAGVFVSARAIMSGCPWTTLFATIVFEHIFTLC